MRRLTLKEVNERYGGTLPADAVLCSDEGEQPVRPALVVPTNKRSERFGTLNAFVDVALVDLAGAEVRVWLVLFRDVKSATGTARTGQADIARRAGIDVRTVRRAIAALEAKGMLRTVRRGRLNAGPTVYRVHPVPSP